MFRPGDPLPNPGSMRDGKRVVKYNNLFSKMNSRNLKLDLTLWDTSNVVIISGLFFECKASEIDVSKWDTSNVERMNQTFEGVELDKLDITNWDTSKVIDMEGMFKTAEIDDVDLSNFNMEKVKSIRVMFHDARIPIINLGKCNANNIWEMYWTFEGAGVRTIDISCIDLTTGTSTENFAKFRGTPSTVYVKNLDSKNIVDSFMHPMDRNRVVIGSLNP